MDEEHSSNIQQKVLGTDQLEEKVTEDGNLVYDVVDEEQEIHMRTWIALLAMFLLNLVQVFALQGPPAVVSAQMISTLSVLSS